MIGLSEEDGSVRANGPQGARWLSADQLFDQAEVIAIESPPKDHARDAKRALQAALAIRGA